MHSIGQQFGGFCPVCIAKGHTGYMRARDSDYASICGACGELWPVDSTFGWKGRGHAAQAASRAHDRAIAMLELAELDRIICKLYSSRRLRWPFRTYFLAELCSEDARRSGVRELAAIAAELWPCAPFEWNKDRVHRWVPEGRAIFAERMVDAGLLRHRGGATERERVIHV